MKLGTVAYKNKIYNLDYMSTDEMEKLLSIIEADKLSEIKEVKSILKR